MTGRPKKKDSKKRAAATGVTSLMKELWQAAVTLRGSIEPADYKRYVLPIIFLRFLSLRFERRRKELESLIRDRGSDYYTTNAKKARSILGDADEYRSHGAFIIPEKARWEYLRANAQSDKIKVLLDDALESLERAYPGNCGVFFHASLPAPTSIGKA